jgi:hypothetical protein
MRGEDKMTVCDKIKSVVNNAARDETSYYLRWQALRSAVDAGIADEKTMGYFKEALYGSRSKDEQMDALLVVEQTRYVDPDILSGIYRCVLQNGSHDVRRSAVSVLGTIISQLDENERIRICEQIRSGPWAFMQWDYPFGVIRIVRNSGIGSVENLGMLVGLPEKGEEDHVMFPIPGQAKKHEIAFDVLVALAQLGWGDIARPELERVARGQGDDTDIADPTRRTAIDALLQMDPDNEVAIDALRSVLSALSTSVNVTAVEEYQCLVRKFGIVDKSIVDSLIEIAQKHPARWGRIEAIKTLSRLPLKDREKIIRALRRGLDDNDVHTRSSALGALVYVWEATTDDINRVSRDIQWKEFVEALWGIRWNSLPREIYSVYVNPPPIPDNIRHELIALSSAPTTDSRQEPWRAMARLLLGKFNEHDVDALIEFLERPNIYDASQGEALTVLSTAWLAFGCNPNKQLFAPGSPV